MLNFLKLSHKSLPNYWLDGIMGVVVGDALGNPVQFESRQQVATHPITGMRGGGIYLTPSGTWTDDSSLTLATLISIYECHQIDLYDIMDRFVDWLDHGKYTPSGVTFDQGRCTVDAIFKYKQSHDPSTCGCARERDNGNGALMRIMPVCLFCWEQEQTKRFSIIDSISAIDSVSCLTHRHDRSKIACGLYYFMIRQILYERHQASNNFFYTASNFQAILQRGLQTGLNYYNAVLENRTELEQYHRLFNLTILHDTNLDSINSDGYVVHTLEASIWSLLHSHSFRRALLTAVNLGNDADTIGAVTGGLAGLYYGYDNIPSRWLTELAKHEAIESLCKHMKCST